MSPTLQFLLTVFVGFIVLVAPFVLIFGVLYPLKRRLEPQTEIAPSRFKMPFNAHPIAIAAMCLVVAAAMGIVGYALVTSQFLDLMTLFRDVVVLAYVFLLRVVAPFVVLYFVGSWLERKLNPAAARARRPIGERVPILKRLPQLTPRGTLFMLFITILWLSAIGIAISRFFFGLAYVTNLTDEFPWGLWIGFDVVSGVALAAGGFVVAGTVHVFNLKRYHPIVRPAILTALLGYLLVIFGLLFDLGRWYNVWHPIFMWNAHSPMLEVAWCVMLYTVVLMLEFSPVVFEKFKIQWALKIMRAITIPLVILGMCLSTLHQSSLGTLFVIAPEKINPLWCSAWMPAFFFLSAVGVGLGMTILESNFSSRALGRELESHLLAGLGRAASVVIAIYLIARFVELIARGAIGYAFQPGFHMTIFWIEILLGFVAPMVLMAFPRARAKPGLVFLSGGLIVFGVVFNRLNTSLLGWWQYAKGGAVYVPSLNEIIVTVTLISVGVVVFGLAAKFLPLFPAEAHAHA